MKSLSSGKKKNRKKKKRRILILADTAVYMLASIPSLTVRQGLFHLLPPTPPPMPWLYEEPDEGLPQTPPPMPRLYEEPDEVEHIKEERDGW